jgi:hypothetical protein
MKFSLDYCEHRVSHAGQGASDSLIIPNGRIMDKNCLRPVYPLHARNYGLRSIWDSRMRLAHASISNHGRGCIFANRCADEEQKLRAGTLPDALKAGVQRFAKRSILTKTVRIPSVYVKASSPHITYRLSLVRWST